MTKMSFQITISANRRAAARFVMAVQRAIQKAYVEEQKSGLTQTAIARALGVHRSVINRELHGKKDLTLGRVAELAWAMGRVPSFGLKIPGTKFLYLTERKKKVKKPRIK
jgi:plasmid maintenance system antidote protein VapI